MFGAVSRIEGDCARGREVVDERYDRRGEAGLGGPEGEQCVLNFTRTVVWRLVLLWELPTCAEDDHCEGAELASS